MRCITYLKFLRSLVLSRLSLLLLCIQVVYILPVKALNTYRISGFNQNLTTENMRTLLTSLSSVKATQTCFPPVILDALAFDQSHAAQVGQEPCVAIRTLGSGGA